MSHSIRYSIRHLFKWFRHLIISPRHRDLGKPSKTKSFSYPTYWGHKAFKQNRSDSCNKWNLFEWDTRSSILCCFLCNSWKNCASWTSYSSWVNFGIWSIQTKIRGLSLLVRACYYWVTESSWVGTHLISKKQKTKLTEKIGITVSLRNLSQN